MERPCLKVRRELASRALGLLREMDLLDRAFSPRREDAFVFFPLSREPTPVELEALTDRLGQVEVARTDFEPREKPKSLLEILSRALPPDLLEEVPRSFDVVGDIAIVEVSPPLWPHRSILGEALMEVHRRIRLVLAKGGPISGPFRLRELVPIAGSGPTETIHREHGCVFKLDVAKVYFSPRLSYEHARVASQVGAGEVVIDMFAGVGPFSILIARRTGGCLVFAIDINPVAIHYLAENVRLNKVRGLVVPVLADAREAVEKALEGLADRIIMNFPEGAKDFLGYACRALKPEGGIIHFYTFAGAPDPEGEAVRALIEGVEEAGRELRKVLVVRKVRAVGPFRWQVVVDAEVA